MLHREAGFGRYRLGRALVDAQSDPKRQTQAPSQTNQNT